MAVEIEPARFLCWRAADAWDCGAADVPRLAALAKAHATDVATRTAPASVEAHSGIGYTWDYPLHLLLKRAMHDRIVYGTPPVLRAGRGAEPGLGRRVTPARAPSPDRWRHGRLRAARAARAG